MSFAALIEFSFLESAQHQEKHEHEIMADQLVLSSYHCFYLFCALKDMHLQTLCELCPSDYSSVKQRFGTSEVAACNLE